ncbi:thioredoxin domain-containing protein [Nannocystis radixulma]|uniref:Thioredoxin domain-containing protein n=1 Tax=Nannocystis radixulma TaxID=2995305 RepID=A0ABT5BI05_9BACT|nr:thioredoxin domain-containing protein [Nannocystis radixulma]MDC0673790.1 thioredoxin domain-containing protein [Nannocystis radixulma]
MSVRTLTCAAALVFVAGCLSERGGKSSATKPQVAAAAAAAKAPSGPPAMRAAATPGSSLCEQASLKLAPGSVVAQIDGVDVKLEDLGDQLAQAENKALRQYCGEVARVREAALDSFVQQKVLTAAAEKAGKPINEYVQGRLDAAVPTPSDADIEAFYNTRKSPDAPPLEAVKDQVIQAINAEKSEQVFTEMLAELKATATVEKRLPDVRPPALELAAAHSPWIGSSDAKVQVVEFSDFECPYCSRAADTLKQLKDKYADKPVQFVFRHFPLSFHPNARPAAEYAQCAHEQEKFWPLHDAIFAAQRELSTDKLKELAGQVGLDTAKLDECLARVGQIIETDMKVAGEAGVGGTPSFYINGQTFEGNPTVAGLSEAIDAELARAKG